MSRIVELKAADREGSGIDFEEGENLWQYRFREYGERVLKYVPAEVVALYSAAVQLILVKDGDSHRTFRLWAFAIVGVVAWVGTPFYIGAFSSKPKERLANQVMATTAFGVWAYAYPAGLPAELGWHDPVIAGLLLIGFTFGSGLYQPRK